MTPTFKFVRLITSEESERARRAKQLGLVIDDHANAVRDLDRRHPDRRPGGGVGLLMFVSAGLILGFLIGLVVAVRILAP